MEVGQVGQKKGDEPEEYASRQQDKQTNNSFRCLPTSLHTWATMLGRFKPPHGRLEGRGSVSWPSARAAGFLEGVHRNDKIPHKPVDQPRCPDVLMCGQERPHPHATRRRGGTGRYLVRAATTQLHKLLARPGTAWLFYSSEQHDVDIVSKGTRTRRIDALTAISHDIKAFLSGEETFCCFTNKPRGSQDRAKRP